MPYKFRNPGPWGGGSLEDLDAIDVDNNFWQAIQDNRAKAAQGVGISNIIVSGNQWTVVLTDHTLLGPYPLPVVEFVFKGEWLPNYAYLGGSIITHGGSTYFIPINHTSEATFDPGANDGHGVDFYELLLQNATQRLDDLIDVDVTTTAPAQGGALIFDSGIWVPGAPVVGVSTLADLTDVSLSSPVYNQALVYNGSFWINMAVVVNFSDLGGSPTPLQLAIPTNFPATSGSITVNPDTANVFFMSLTGNITISAAHVNDGQMLTFVFFGSISTAYNVTFLGGSGNFRDIAGNGLQFNTGKFNIWHTITFMGSNGFYHEIARATLNRRPPIAVTSSDIDPRSGDLFTLTPSGNVAFTALSGAPQGHEIIFIFTTSGTISYTMSFTTNFIAQGNLVTGTVSGKTFTVKFVGNGAKYVEVSRTVAM